MIAEFTATLGTLLVLHDLADHVTGQTDEQAKNKMKTPAQCVAEDMHKHTGYKALAGHILGYHATLFAGLVVVYALLDVNVTWLGIFAGLLFSAVTHAFFDLRWPVRMVLEYSGSPKFADMLTPVCGMYQADQALHKTALLVSSLLIVGLS